MGFNLSVVQGTLGGHTQANHNSLIRIISQWAKKAGIQHRGGTAGNTCKTLFLGATNNVPQDRVTTNQRKIDSIIADMVLLTAGVPSPEGTASVNYLVDVKTIAAGNNYRSNEAIFNHASTTRQSRVNTDYHNKAKELDQRLHHTPIGQLGPFQRVLREYGGLNGRVLGPVIGYFGEASPDVALIRDLIVHQLALRHVDGHGGTIAKARDLYKSRINHEWGHQIKRGWADIVLGRQRDCLGRLETRINDTIIDAHELFQFQNGHD
jgi:hypothetical protein